MKEDLKELEKLKKEAVARKLNHEQTDDFLKHRYYWKNPDPTFNEREARETINRTIAKYENDVKTRKKIYFKELGDRTQALYSWLKYRERGGSKGMEKWFGRKMMAYLKAEQIGAIAGKNGAYKLFSES